MKKLLCTDMDGTIICNCLSNENLICVATKNNKPSSFMTNDSYNLFQTIINHIDTIPITTRCEKSYNNIILNKFFKYALVDNGAILLCDNITEKKQWIEESKKIINEDKNDFEKVRKILEKYNYKEKWGSEFVLDYVNTDTNKDIIENISNEVHDYNRNILINIKNTSITCTYKKLSKGENIKRFANKYNYELFISLGDSKEDESMFKVTQYSVGKKNATYNYKIEDKLEYCNQVIKCAHDIVIIKKE